MECTGHTGLTRLCWEDDIKWDLKKKEVNGFKITRAKF